MWSQFEDNLNLADMQIRCYESGLQQGTIYLSKSYDGVCKDLSIIVARLYEAHDIAMQHKPALAPAEYIMLHYVVTMFCLRQISENPDNIELLKVAVSCIRGIITAMEVFNQKEQELRTDYIIERCDNIIQLLQYCNNALPAVLPGEAECVVKQCLFLKKIFIFNAKLLIDMTDLERYLTLDVKTRTPLLKEYFDNLRKSLLLYQSACDDGLG